MSVQPWLSWRDTPLVQSDQLSPWVQMTSSCRILCMSFLYGVCTYEGGERSISTQTFAYGYVGVYRHNFSMALVHLLLIAQGKSKKIKME